MGSVLLLFRVDLKEGCVDGVHEGGVRVDDGPAFGCSLRGRVGLSGRGGWRRWSRAGDHLGGNLSSWNVFLRGGALRFLQRDWLLSFGGRCEIQLGESREKCESDQ